jgi:hypothetical protein
VDGRVLLSPTKKRRAKGDKNKEKRIGFIGFFSPLGRSQILYHLPEGTQAIWMLNVIVTKSLGGYIECGRDILF